MNSWKRISDFGILNDSQADPNDAGSPWHAARLFDVLRVGGVASGPLLCANRQSGLWIVNPLGGPAIPLSWDWPAPNVWTGPKPDVVCLAQGLTSQHVYAGGSALSETDVTKPAPLFNWRSISIADANKKDLKPGTINRIVVISQLQKLVLACDNGVFWAHIPPPGGTYVFQQAALPGQRFSGLALGLGTSVIAGAWGTNLSPVISTLHAGIFVGTWATGMGPLNFKPATIFDVNVRLMRRTDIAACANDRRFLYAVCSGGNPTKPEIDPATGKFAVDAFGNVVWTNDDDFILRVLRSEDGGVTWHRTGKLVIDNPQPLFPGSPKGDVAGHTQNGYTGCIGVSPFDPAVVAIGMTNQLLSKNHGEGWQLFTDDSGPGNLHRHADTHAMVFDPALPGTLHICCDGGLVTTSDLGTSWQTGANRQLPNLEFYKVAPSLKDSGLVAGSLQDNGNIYAPQYITLDPWKTLDYGDGVMTQFVSTGDLLRQNNTLEAPDASGTQIEYGRQVRAASWDSKQRRFTDRSMFSTSPLSQGVIPVDNTGAGLTVPAGEDGLELTEPVATPTFANSAGELMVAVGINGLTVLGLFAKSDGNSHWTPLTTVPSLPDLDPTTGKPKPYFLSAITSPDGTFIIIGTNNGKVFRVDTPNSVTNISDPVISLEIIRIVAFAPDRAFLIAGPGMFRLSITPSGTATWIHVTGKVLPSGVPATLPGDQPFNALAADPTTTPPTLYVAGGAGIFESRDNGDSWLPFVDGLPTAPLCQDLRWVQEESGVTFLYLATQGWSVFRRVLNVQEGSFSTLSVDGHMDLTDRVLLGTFTGDDYTAVWFMDSRVLGPFHPIDQMKFHGDETTGGEIHADLTLDLLWKVDSSVLVTWDAEMKADDDSESNTGSVAVPVGDVGEVAISLKTGELEPDRAEIDFNATNV